MALMTRKIQQQLSSLSGTLDQGLPATLNEYLRQTLAMLYQTAEDFPSRAALQRYIDTLQDLITTKVHHPYD